MLHYMHEDHLAVQKGKNGGTELPPKTRCGERTCAVSCWQHLLRGRTRYEKMLLTPACTSEIFFRQQRHAAQPGTAPK